jgi:hypothetical protein
MLVDISFVVISCDRYKDLWQPFFSSYEKYWSELPFKVYMISNHENYNSEKVTTIKIGEDLSYTENLINGIEQIDSKWILLWLEDCIPSKRIDINLFNDVISKAINNNNLGYLKLSNDLPLVYETNDSGLFGNIPKGVRYRSAVGMSLYRKDVLNKLLVPGENAWETDKSAVSDSLDEEFCALSKKFFAKPLMPYVNTVIKGKWSRAALDFLQKEGFGDLIKLREKESLKGYLYIKLFYLWSLLLVTFKLYWYRK